MPTRSKFSCGGPQASYVERGSSEEKWETAYCSVSGLKSEEEAEVKKDAVPEKKEEEEINK
jgi:hypothetical protein